MTLNYADQVQKTGTVTVVTTAKAVNIELGWTPRYVRAWNVDDLIVFEYFDGMDAGTSLNTINHADTQLLVNAELGITQYAGRAAGTAITGTGAITADSAAVAGTSTNFVGELVVGDKITINGETRTVLVITSATALTADAPFTTTNATAAIYDVEGKGLGVTLGADICATAADVVRWAAFR
jgi:hypothetical protein